MCQITYPYSIVWQNGRRHLKTIPTISVLIGTTALPFSAQFMLPNRTRQNSKGCTSILVKMYCIFVGYFMTTYIGCMNHLQVFVKLKCLIIHYPMSNTGKEGKAAKLPLGMRNSYSEEGIQNAIEDMEMCVSDASFIISA